ncbi:MAG TPA: DUF2905 family protein [Candidatus Hydrogenedens sp.]|nr:DUF2905 domain-containing protein [Candidatus Hydrogenedens sp.]HOK09687.1 DUF2905 family protein [Candidatus Hydrogenedens sp.]HOL19276.1 DUF2905 family protein [Candidatus Hydrogenedens sp.]HPP59229.1 DUF2905 family protein [Candidatus Hydrogenedens sp.]
MNSLAKYFFIFGLIFLFISGIIWLSGFLPFKLGKLPGDINIEWEKGNFYFPIATSIILSLLLTIIINLILFALSLLNR